MTGFVFFLDGEGLIMRLTAHYSMALLNEPYWYKTKEVTENAALYESTVYPVLY